MLQVWDLSKNTACIIGCPLIDNDRGDQGAMIIVLQVYLIESKDSLCYRSQTPLRILLL